MSDRRTIPRRQFLRTAVAIGGSSALTACLGRESSEVPRGPTDLSGYPKRQHAWQAVLPRDNHGNVVPPRHRILLKLTLPGDSPPSEADRATMETALQGVEHAYERSGDGLLLTTSYAPRYFDRFDAALPDAVDLPEPEALSPFEDPTLNTADALIHLASNHASVVLGAEEALRGNRETLNGVEQPPESLTDVLAISNRHTGFIGDGLPAENDDVDGVPTGEVPDDAPLYMGFKSGFTKNQASEDSVTIQTSGFRGGTTQHVSTLRLNLQQWYEQDSRWQREAKMFCPHLAETNAIKNAGDNLGTDSGVDQCDPTDETARNMGVVGHSQKTADARVDDEPIILRRDFDSTDDGHAAVHFLALQREIADFVSTREAMNGTDVAANSGVGQRNNNGILQYVDTQRRGNFLLPPRSLRSFPPANPSPAEVLHAPS